MNVKKRTPSAYCEFLQAVSPALVRHAPFAARRRAGVRRPPLRDEHRGPLLAERKVRLVTVRGGQAKKLDLPPSHAARAAVEGRVRGCVEACAVEGRVRGCVEACAGLLGGG